MNLSTWFVRKPDRYLTIKVITDTGSTTRNYIVGLRTIRNAKIAAVVLTFLFVVGIIAIVNSVYSYRELTYLEARNELLERQSQHAADLRNELAQIWIINERLQRMLGGETTEIAARPTTRALPWGTPLATWAGDSYRIHRTERFDAGVTFETMPNTLVLATADGIVRDMRWNTEHGDMLIVDHGEGVQTAYGRDFAVIARPGERVVQGQVLGVVNDAEGIRQPLLHYRVLVDGVSVNPLAAMSEFATNVPVYSMISLP